MSGNRNDFQPLTDTTTAPTGLIWATGAGSAIGITEASKVVSEVMEISSEQLFKRDSLLATLQALIQNQELPANIPGINMFGDLKDCLDPTARVVAKGVSGGSIAPTFTLTHASQLPIDFSSGLWAAAKSTDNPKEFTKLQASTLHFQKELQNDAQAFSAHCKFLCEEFAPIFNRMAENVDEFRLGSSHGTLAKSTGAISGIATLAASSLIAGGMDAIGSLFREISASREFVTHESFESEEEENIYHAFSECSRVFLNTKNLNDSLNALKKLRDAIWNFTPATEMSDIHSVSSPFFSILTRGLLSTPFVLSLESVISSAEAVLVSNAAFTEQKKELLKSSQQSVSKAGSIKNQSDGGKTHFENVSDLSNQFQAVIDQIDAELNAPDQESAVESTASLSVRLISVLSLIPSLMIGLEGILSREMSGTVDFTKEDKGTQVERQKVLQSNTNHLAHDLDQLMSRVWQLQERIDRCKELGVSAPVILGLMHVMSSGASFPAIMALQNSLATFLATGASARALTKEKDVLSKHGSDSLPNASTLQQQEEGGEKNTHFKNLSILTNDFRQISHEIDVELHQVEGARHQNLAAGTGKASITAISALSAIPNLITAVTGVLSRELSAVMDFIKHDVGTRKQRKQVSKSDRDRIGADLDNLMSEVCKMRDRLKKSLELGASAPSLLGTSHVATCGALIASLNTLAGTYFALRELRSVIDSEPSARLELDQEEKAQAKQYGDSIEQSNKDSAGFSKTGSVSDNITLHQNLQSVMEKVVLMHRASFDFLQPGADNINKSGHSLINLTHMNTSGSLWGALGVLASVALECGISAESFWRALRLAFAKSHILSKGPDESKTGQTSQFNLSFLSNLTRLMAEQSEDPTSSLSKTSLTAVDQLAELTFSRSLTVALCQSGVLTQALKELIKEVQKDKVNPNYFLNSAASSGRIMSQQLTGKIKEILDKAGNDIPGLNEDMARELASVSEASISTALSSHSVFIAPLFQAFSVATQAFKTDVQQKEEGVADISIIKDISTASNIVQAFTRNCIDQLNQNANELFKDDLNEFNSAMQSHLKSNGSTATVLLANCYTSLLCDELIESIMSRSLGLINVENLQKSTTQSSEVTQGEAKEASKQIGKDSQLKESASATRMISALRLTLTHIGQSLARIGSELEKKSKKEPLDIEKANMQMHTSQQTFLRTLAASFSSCSLSMSKIVGVLSVLPESTLGSIDDMRHFIQSLDSVKWNNSGSADRTRKDADSEPFVSFGLSIDSTAATILLFIKSLLKSMVLGSESALSVAKIIEIFSSHQRPEQAFSLLIQEALQPHGSSAFTQSTKSAVTAPTVGVSAASIAVLKNTQTNESDSNSNKIQNSLQDTIDTLIDAYGFLEDDEENTEMKLGLKKFFEELMIILNQNENIHPVNQADYKDIVAMLNRGGIALASYHSATNKNNPLISEQSFLGCNDASTLVIKFMRTASADDSKEAEKWMNQLSNKLQEEGKNYSSKVTHLWDYIINQVGDDLVLKTRSASSNLAKSSFLAKREFDLETFKTNLALKTPVERVIYQPR